MASRNDEMYSWGTVPLIPQDSRVEGVNGVGFDDVRAVVAQEFSLMEQTHDRIRALELSVHLGKKKRGNRGQ